MVEGSQSSGYRPMFAAEGMGGGGGAPIEPGTSSLSKTVTVTFKLK